MAENAQTELLPGELAAVLLPDGRRLAVLPLTYGAARLGVGSPDFFDGGIVDVWDYPTPHRAIIAMLAWDGTGEPTGWHRHLLSGRRRSNGDPKRETVVDVT